MNIFIAAHSQEMARSVKRQLEALGHTVVARWIENDTKFGQGAAAYSYDERRALAEMDEADVRRSDMLVLLAETEGKLVPGGKHVETGIALGLGLPVVVVGRRENIFHWHSGVKVVQSIDCLFKLLDARTRIAGRAGVVAVSDSVDETETETH
ncbi:MAG: hypothetical protein AAFR38_14045 [Planctomycetota bacterium]